MSDCALRKLQPAGSAWEGAQKPLYIGSVAAYNGNLSAKMSRGGVSGLLSGVPPIH